MEFCGDHQNQKIRPTLDNSGTHFGSILGTEMGPLRGGQMSGNTRNSKVFTPDWAHPPGPISGYFWDPFRAHFGVNSGSILGPILGPFWTPFWVLFGLHLETPWGYPGSSKCAPGLTKQSLFLKSTPWTRSGK